MTQLTENISLKSFYVYNSTYGPNEGEEEKKILYYYPSHVNVENQIKEVGLSEAIIKFTNTFTSDEFCESLHTQKTRQLFFQPETNFWMVMTVNVPHAYITRESITYCEYHGDEVQDIVLRAVLKQSYDTYKLFRGTFQKSLKQDSTDTSLLKSELKQFFSKYVLTLRLLYCDVLDVMRGMQIMPLDSLSFLKVQTFVNLTEATFPIIRRTAFLYNELLVWSGIESSDMQIIYTHLVTSLLPAHLETELQRCLITPPLNTNEVQIGHFVAASSMSYNQSDGETAGRYITTVNLSNGDVYKLVVYKVLSCSICLLIDVSQNISGDLMQELKMFMAPHMMSIGSEIAEKCSQTINTPNTNSNTAEAVPKYLFFNEIERAYRSTLHRDNRKMGNLAVTNEAMRLIADVHADNFSSSTSSETILKTSNDYWVVGNLSNHRYFYVVLQQKNTNLIEISNEFKRICDKELKYVFFQN